MTAAPAPRGSPTTPPGSVTRVRASVNVPLADLPLRRLLEERLGVPVFVDNDATVVALAEAHDDELSMVSRNLVMLTSGPGSAAASSWAVASIEARRNRRSATSRPITSRVISSTTSAPDGA